MMLAGKWYAYATTNTAAIPSDAEALIIIYSINNLIHGIEITNLDAGTCIVFAAFVVNLALGGYLVWQERGAVQNIGVGTVPHPLPAGASCTRRISAV